MLHPSRLLTALLCVIAITFSSLAPSARASDAQLTIVATTGMIADVATNVAGDRATVTSLMGPGVDPHLYKATRSDIAKLRRADIIFYNGLLLEGKMTDAFIRLAVSGKPVYAVTELLEEDFLLAPEEFAGHHDPHVWMDPTGWARTVDVVEQMLTKHDPDGATTYSANAKAYKAEIARLDEYARRVLATIPEQQRVLVTAHDAFNYLARAYQIEVRGIQGISTESEAGVREIEQIVSLVVDRGIPSVFTESTVSDRNVRAIIAGARRQSHTIKLGGELFSDAMGAPGTYEGTYIGMIDHNVTAIARSLGGEAPAGGMNGKLSQADHE